MLEEDSDENTGTQVNKDSNKPKPFVYIAN